MGNSVSCFDPIREHPPYSWPKDHPEREAAIRERKLARRNQKIHSSHPASKSATRETPNDLQPTSKPVAPPPATSHPASDPETKSLLDAETQPIVPDTPPQPTSSEAAATSVPDTSPDGEDSITVEQAPPTIENSLHEDLQSSPARTSDPGLATEPSQIDSTAEEPIPAPEVLADTDSRHSDEMLPQNENATFEQDSLQQTPMEEPTSVNNLDSALKGHVLPPNDTLDDDELPTEGAAAVESNLLPSDDDTINGTEKETEQGNEIEQPPTVLSTTDDDEQQYADADDLQQENVEIPTDVSPEVQSEVPTEAAPSSIDTRRAIFDKANDDLPEAKEIKRDVLDPVTNEYISLKEYRERQLERAQGVVRERVEKFEEIDDELSRQKAKLAAIEAARHEAKEKTWTFKSEKSIPKSPVSKLNPASYIQDSEKFIDAAVHSSPDSKMEPTIKDELLSTNIRNDVPELNPSNALDEEKQIASVPDVKVEDLPALETPVVATESAL